MAEEKDNTVYISYASKSKRIYDEIAQHYNVETNSVDHERDSFVDMLYKQLTAEGIPCKLDTVDVQGGSITEFEQAIGNANYVVVVLSDKYFISPHCMYEWDLIQKDAEEKKKNIYYVYFTGETIRCEDGTEFKGIDCPIKDNHKDYYPKVIRPVWEKRYKKLRDELDETYRELSAVEAYFCNGDIKLKSDIAAPIRKAYLFKNTFESITSKLKDVSVIRDTNTGEEKKLVQYIKNKLGLKEVDSQNSGSDVATCKPSFDFHPNYYCDDDEGHRLFGRRKLAEALHGKFFNEGKCCVNVVAMGGQGKTMFAHRYKELYKDDYGYIHHFSIYHGLDDGFVLGFDDVFHEKKFWDNLNRYQIDHQRRLIIDELKEIPLKDNKPNLLVVDINIHREDDEEKYSGKVLEKVFDPKFMDDFKVLNGKWHVLLLSRLPFKDRYYKTEELDVEDNIIDRTELTEILRLPSLIDDEEEAVAMFREIFLNSVRSKNGVKDVYNMQLECEEREIIKVLRYVHYHPLLITTLAAYCGRNGIKDYDDIIKSLGLSLENKVPNKELIRSNVGGFDVYGYLDRLIDFKEFESPRCEELLRHFILWPYDYVPLEVVDTLLAYYNEGRSYQDYLNILVNDMVLTPNKEEYRVYGYTIPQYCDFLVRNYKKDEYKGCTEDNVKEYEKKLRDDGYPLMQHRGYQIHGMLAESLRKKALSQHYDYSRYSDRIRDLLINPTKTNLFRNCFTYLYKVLYDKYEDLEETRLTKDVISFIKNVSNPKNDLHLFAAAHYNYYSGLHMQTVYDWAKKKLAEFVVNKSEDGRYLMSLADSLHDFAIVLNSKSEQTLAKFALNKAVEARKVICERQYSIENRKYLALEYCTLSRIDVGNAKAYCQEGISLLDEYDSDSLALKYQMNHILQNDNECVRIKNILQQDDKSSFLPEMVDVFGGEFYMGCTDNEAYSDEKYVHRVMLSDFKIGKYPVTQYQWDCIMGDDIPSVVRCDIHRGFGADYPMYNITWEEADEYCRKLNEFGNYHLPTEAQWEYAARGGCHNDVFKYSGGSEIDDVAWHYENSGATTHRVGEKNHPNSLCIHDMSGNVREWCQDWYDNDYYKKCMKDNQIERNFVKDPCCNESIIDDDFGSSARVLRGGSWISGVLGCRVSNRSKYFPFRRSCNIGFRLALSFAKH
ncbi:MAG: SUMF1/EgtB/PvdO family nonheme iron enzyme [Bacteroidales bacterium]|nr:SUMF1/EgtB/PvdO family nonheme iron enzyme [Bacteroidales bacterium]